MWLNLILYWFQCFCLFQSFFYLHCYTSSELLLLLFVFVVVKLSDCLLLLLLTLLLFEICLMLRFLGNDDEAKSTGSSQRPFNVISLYNCLSFKHGEGLFVVRLVVFILPRLTGRIYFALLYFLLRRMSHRCTHACCQALHMVTWPGASLNSWN